MIGVGGTFPATVNGLQGGEAEPVKEGGGRRSWVLPLLPPQALEVKSGVPS